MAPIVQYLKDGTLPEEKIEARKLRVRAACFVLLVNTLYKMVFPMMPQEVDYVLREVHNGICGNHSGARALAHKLTRAGYLSRPKSVI